MTSVRSMASLTGGLGERNSTLINTVNPLIVKQSDRKCEFSVVYGITHWWFRRKEFYINKHSEPSAREAVRSQMRILSVISVKVFEMSADLFRKALEITPA
ncbi:hypothetical protein Tco_1451464 [Tanacetum coccineum]